MDTLKGIFTKKEEKKEKKSPSEETQEISSEVPVMEVSETEETERIGEIEPILVKSVDLTSLVDVQEVASELRDGNIIILNISPLMDEDPGELKRSIDQLKNLADEIDGDVGRLSESRIIATPKLVQIQFKREA